MNVDKRSEQYNLYMGSLEWIEKEKKLSVRQGISARNAAYQKVKQ